MLALGDKIIAGSFKAGASWEVGDVGISAFGIDEALNKRRYLNGQVISQAQFVEFTAMLKSRVSVYPNLATTEVNWQAEVTNSKLGQCGQFVIDDVAGTIRLPKVVNINGLQNLALLGGIKAESLPNIKGRTSSIITSTVTSEATGALYDKDGTITGTHAPGASSGYAGIRWYFDASRSSSTYQDNAPVQQEAVQYPYFIQVATGVETSIDVSREIELNNPFSLLDYKYSEYELANASWLLSNGQFNSGATYSAVYDLLLQIYNGTVTKAGVSVKLSTETYADTDFVLNTGDTTFRLPTKVLMAGSKRISGTGKTLGLTNGNQNGALYKYTNAYAVVSAHGYDEDLSYNTHSGDISDSSRPYFGVTTDETKSGIETSANGLYLYFYVGETVQDANIIAAASVLTDMANIKNGVGFSDLGKTFIAHNAMPSDTYIDLTLGASDTVYTAPADGWFSISKIAGSDWYTIYLRVLNENETVVLLSQTVAGYRTTELKGSLPVRKGQKFQMWYNTTGATNYFRFVYAKGSESEA